MVKSIKRIAPVQLGKLMAVVYVFFSLIFVPIFLVSAFFAPGDKGPGPIFYMVLPIIHIVFGFIGGIVGAVIYNISAKWVGGIEIEFEEE